MRLIDRFEGVDIARLGAESRCVQARLIATLSEVVVDVDRQRDR